MTKRLHIILLLICAGTSVLRATPSVSPASGGTVWTSNIWIGDVKYVRMEAMPYDNRYFVGWTDGCARNPRMVPDSVNNVYQPIFDTNTEKAYTALFTKYSDKGGTPSFHFIGSTEAGEAFNLYTTVNSGIDFVGWSVDHVLDGNNTPTRTFYINSDAVIAFVYSSAQETFDITHTATRDTLNGHIYTTEIDGGFVHILDTGCVTNHLYTFTAEAKPGFDFAGWTDEHDRIISRRNPWIVDHPKGGNTIIYHALFVRSHLYHLSNDTIENEGGQTTIARATSNGFNHFTLTAHPAAGYRFLQWSNGTTDNPYTYTATNQQTNRLQAVFGAEQTSYNLAFTPSHGRIDTTGTNYLWCNPRYLMTAVPDEGYEFIGWSDGSVRNPRVFFPQGQDQTTVTAEFRALTMYVATADNGPAWQITYDTVSCTPHYRVAIANPERYQFLQWLDSASNHSDRDFAPFPKEKTYRFRYQVQKFPYLYDVSHSPATIDDATVGSIEQLSVQTPCHTENDTIPTLRVQAIPAAGYEFIGWVNARDSIVSVRNPRIITDTAYALFRRADNNLYPAFKNIRKYVTMSVDKDGCRPRYTFHTPGDDFFSVRAWSDGKGNIMEGVVNKFTVTPDSARQKYSLIFDPYKFAFGHTVAPENAAIGTVQIADSAHSICDTTFYRLQAVPQPGYYFTGWSDGSTRNPRMLHPTRHDEGFTFTANFSNQAPGLYSIYREGDRGGAITIDPPTVCSDQYTFAFDRNLGYHFVKWKNIPTADSLTESRTETVSHGLTRTALWSHDKMEFYQPSKTDEVTTVDQLGDLCNPVFLFYARSPQPGYLFTRWDDGSTENPRVVYPVGNQTFMASFSFAGCNSTASYLNQLCGGTITYTTHTTVGTAQTCGCTYTATANPRAGYIFAGWSDNDSLIQTRGFSLNDHVEQSFTALFVSDDRKYLEWTDQALLLSTYAADLRDCNVFCYINRTPTDTFSVSYDAQHPGRFTVPVADIAQHAGDTLKLVFHNPLTDQYVLATDIIIPVVVANDSAWSQLCAASRIPANIGQTGVVVRDGATLTIDNTGIAMGNLDILDSSKVVVNKPISVAGITMRGDALQDQYPQLIPNASVSNTNGDTIYYDYTLDHNYYYPLALPNTTLCADIRTRFDEPASYQAYDYDGATRATGATGWRTYDDTQLGAAFSAGQGYMLYAVARKWNGIRQEAAFMRIPFHYNMNSGEPYDKEVAVFEYGTTDAPDNDRNWNLIGNPYLANLSGDFDEGQQVHVGQLVQHMENGHWTGTYDWTGDLRYVTIPKNGFQEYEQVHIEEATLRPFNSYFIQSSGTGTLVFDVSRKASAPARVREINKEAYVDIQLSNDTHSDYTGLMVGENFTTAYEMNADLSKMMGGKEPVSVYLLDGTQPMAFLATTHDAARQTIPVGYRSTASQPMTFSLRDPLTAAALFEAVYLTDYERGTTVDLLTEQYRFTPTTSQSDTRFALNAVIRRQPTVTTDVETITPTLQGQGRMLPGIYDLTGRRIASIDEPCTGIVPGVYIIITENEIRKEVLR